ncbi:MAG: phosphate signaling complex protein PhoU [Deltaproteobacteria bacterium]|nr:phosphate signaling complex protein PhoU [Deltaproteobacteria bacterium]
MILSLHKQIGELKTNLLKMASMSEEAIRNAMTALETRDRAMCSAIIQKDKQINFMENLVDKQCLELLALKQPMAIDLRFITMAMRIATELERVGDQAENIAERTLFLIEEPVIMKPAGFSKLARVSQEMLRDSINAFVNGDVNLAETVCERDNEADELYLHLICDILEQMIADSSFVRQGVHFTVIALNLERVADQATNICEDVVYLVEGRVIKHRTLLKKEGCKRE